MNGPSCLRAAESTGGKFYTPLVADALLTDLPKPSKVPLDTDPPIPLWNTWPVLGVVPDAAHGGVGFPKTQTNGMILDWFSVQLRGVSDGLNEVNTTLRPVYPEPGGRGDSSQLESRIKGLRNSLRRLLALHGLSWVFGVVVPLVILAGLADWLFHLDSVIRAALLAALAWAALWLAYRAHRPAARRPVRRSRHRAADRGAVAGLERSAGEHDPVPAHGRRRSIAWDRRRCGKRRSGRPSRKPSAIDFREVIEPKPVIRALLAASAALAGGGCACS